VRQEEVNLDRIVENDVGEVEDKEEEEDKEDDEGDGDERDIGQPHGDQWWGGRSQTTRMRMT
jgi:hypothetical protein